MDDQSVVHDKSSCIFNAIDIEVLVNNMISRFGRYHKLLVVVLCFHNFIVAINYTVTSFHTYTPDFYCRDNNDTTCRVDDCLDGYEFDGEYETLVTEFSLVCSRKLLAPLTNTIFFCGVTVGAILCGTLSDIWGRRLMVLTCMYVQGILFVALYFVENLNIFIAVRTIQGIFVQGLQSSSFALMLEHSGAHNRTGPGCFYDFSWGIGLIYLAVCSYFVPNWHNLQLVLIIPTVLTLIYTWLIPESISWLIARNKIQAAYNESIKVAKWNKDQKFFDEVRELTTKSVKPTDTIEKEPTIHTSIPDMLKHPILRKHTIIMVSIWFAVTLSYYEILYFLPNLAGERHLNFGIGACIEIISYGIAFITFVRYGRRWPMLIYQYLNGSFCLIMAVITLTVGDNANIEDHWSRTLNTVLALLAKGFTVSGFCGMYIYAAELFPTGCRGAALGLCGLFSRIGSLLAPQLLVLGDYTFDTFPVIIIGLGVIITGTLTFYLPETLGISLPNSVDDVNELWGKSSR